MSEESIFLVALTKKTRKGKYKDKIIVAYSQGEAMALYQRLSVKRTTFAVSVCAIFKSNYYPTHLSFRVDS